MHYITAIIASTFILIATGCSSKIHQKGSGKYYTGYYQVTCQTKDTTIRKDNININGQVFSASNDLPTNWATLIVNDNTYPVDSLGRFSITISPNDTSILINSDIYAPLEIRNLKLENMSSIGLDIYLGGHIIH